MAEDTKLRLEILLGFKLTRTEVDILRHVERDLDYRPQKVKQLPYDKPLEWLNLVMG